MPSGFRMCRSSVEGNGGTVFTKNSSRMELVDAVFLEEVAADVEIHAETFYDKGADFCCEVGTGEPQGDWFRESS